ncbi:PEP-CTERM sorting domain-containing protein [Aeoliella mucimassa]|uniref:PEP-CTERM motif protein n=1 Tax=Aeoliella mucimassa TaxID=2527972 RepID=A0A518AQG1_9BACT|nr:PEP-CTERM sorting domain-containing protein [Aeoliella mucimassa]QDU56954.1 PEP-CTERM motif protein [Aeoliella mucimassa]
MPLTPDAVNSSQPAYGTDIANLVSDPFAYDPANPTSTNPLGAHSDGFHADEPAGTDVTLIFDFTNGPITLAAGETFKVDLWGRNNCCFNRDDDYEIELYNGGSLVTSIANQMIPDSAPQFNRSVLGTAGETFDSLRIIAHDSNGTGDNNLFTPVEIRAFASLPLNPVLRIDRATGGMMLENFTAGDINIVGYSLQSLAGSLNSSPSEWISISGNYDATSANGGTGDGSVDVDDEWTVLTTTPNGTDLSEGELDGGDGGVLTSGSQINLGTPWRQTPYEDVTAKLLASDGSIFTVPVQYDGNSIQRGDLDGSGALDANDWEEYVSNAMNDLTGLSPAMAYLAGDLNSDGVTNLFDTDLFIHAYEVANGPGSFQAMVASHNVPEPTSWMLLAVGAIGALVVRRKVQVNWLPACVLVIAAAFASQNAHAIDYTWTGTAGDGNWDNASNWDGNGIPVDDNAGDAGLSLAGLDDRIIFSGSTMPSTNVPQIGGRNATGTNSPILQLNSGGSLSLTSGVGGIGGFITNQTAATRTLIIVGDGVGGGTEDVTLNLSHTGALIRHEQEVTHNLLVNSDGTLTFDAGVEFSSELSQSGRPRYGTFTVDGGAVDIAGPLTRFTVAATGDALAVSNFVDFTAPGGTFTAQYGGDLLDLSAVQAAASLAGDGSFRSTSGYSLGVSDNGDNSFTITSLSQLALLVLQVDPNTGSAIIRNPTGGSVDINSYQVTSVAGAIDPDAWNSFSDQNLDPVNSGTNPGETWDQVGPGSSSIIHEGFLLGSTSIPAGGLSIGSIFDETVFGAGSDGDLEFTYRMSDGSLIPGLVMYEELAAVAGDYNGDGTVNLADYTVWRDNLGASDESAFAAGTGNGGGVDASDYSAWKSNFGATIGSGSLAADTQAVPEPSPQLLMLFSCLALALATLSKSNGFGSMKLKKSTITSFSFFGLTAWCVVAWAAAGSTAHAAVTNDREYLFGDPGSADATLAPPSVQTAATVSEGSPMGFVFDGRISTGDETGPSGAYLDLQVFGPTYTSTSARPGASVGEFGARFDGVDDYMTGQPLDRPDSLSNRLGQSYPIDYTGITSRGVQMWAFIDSAKLATDAPQTLLLDSQIFGGPQISADGKWTQANSQHTTDNFNNFGVVPAEVDVVGDTWQHVMHHVYNANDPQAPARLSGGAGSNHVSVIYVNGIAVSSNVDNLPADFDLLSQGFSGSLVVGAEDDGSGGFKNHFQGVLDDIEMYVFGNNETGTPGNLADGEDWGTFDLFSDNEWIANEIATTIPSGVLQPGDVTKDGDIDGDDIDAFIAGWLSEQIQTGAHSSQLVGDWGTWDKGDMNHDGATDLADLYIMNQALAGAGFSGITGDMLAGQAVPEPASLLFALAGAVGLLGLRKVAKSSVR